MKPSCFLFLAICAFLGFSSCSENSNEPKPEAKITITNALGDVVYETVLPEGKKEATVELKNRLSAGMYLVNMISNEERTVEKLVIR